ncbi:MAG TPA: hypothetical protein P5134_04220 [Bacteroidales bacterium]|jgi:hypothetical protein|nr:hypothetical protein [Bacteroidales bacterium]HOS57176.1 hypothetical protein [Bacteroidales bacterium]HRR04059.1 hypothetical protein [Bacteroidales bacterium]HRT13796.1 hypothetical protein [Bacteroidales bacterium]HXK73308.1 hypothetical protein [Bacteroidales bacterium]
MKKAKKIILFLLFFPTILFAQKEFSAKIYDGINFTPIDEAIIYNLTSGNYVFSDKNGNFTISVKLNDTLVISKSIYRQLVVIMDKDNIDFKNESFLLYHKAILLKEVSVYALNPNYEGFKKDVIAIKLPEVYEKLRGVQLSDEDLMNAEYQTKGPNILRNTPLASPITFLYNRYSKKAKMKQLYNEMVQYEDEIDKLEAKYNRELVRELTGLNDDNLMEFMVFCRFSYYDLIRWTPEQIITKIKDKFDEYEYYKVLNDDYD